MTMQHEENKDDDEYWDKKFPDDYQRYIEMSVEPLDYTIKKELYLLFYHGFLANNDNGQLVIHSIFFLFSCWLIINTLSYLLVYIHNKIC